MLDAGLSAVVGCRGQAAGQAEVAIELYINGTPKVGQSVRVLVTLTDPTGAPVSGADVAVEGNMTHAGMAPVLRGAIEREAERYVVEDFVLAMEGDSA